MRSAAILLLTLTLIGCSAPSTAPVANLVTSAPESATLVYTIATAAVYAEDCTTSTVSSVIGYPANTSGPTSPVLTITSPNTVDTYAGLGTDASGNIYVLSANYQSCQEIPGSGKILVFAPATSGTIAATPIRTITGPATQIFGAGRLAVDSAGNAYIWESGSDTPPLAPSTIVEFAAGANGNVAPTRTIDVAQYPNAIGNGSGYPASLAADASGNIVFALSSGEGVTGTVNNESDMIEVFTPGQSGDATPARTIAGPQSQLTQISGLGLDGAGNIYVEMATVGTGANPAILKFAGGADPATSSIPLANITGTATMLDRFYLNSLTVDGPGNIYTLTYNPSGPTIDSMLRFPAGATGDAAPTAAVLSQPGVFAAAH